MGGKTYRRNIVQRDGSDEAYVAALYSGGQKYPNRIVNLIMDKNKHLARGNYGRKLYITIQAFSGFVKAGTESDIGDADKTIAVKMRFTR